VDWLGRSILPYLNGVFAPIDNEIVAADLPVIGKLPDDLCGVYLRNGPNQRPE
jgi:carotenoid cleavage dioxygenase-like enzyme